MNDAQLQRALDRFVKLGNELDAEAKRRYGRSGHLFPEAEGTTFIMSGDADDKFAGMCDRQAFIEFRSNVFATWGGGAW